MPSQKSIQSSKIDRRAILRGVGVTMALPWFESLSAFAATGQAEFPKRFAALFMGCGVNYNHWTAEGQGENIKFGKTLLPLEPLKKKINVINGLYNKPSTGHGIHPAMTGSLLSGAEIDKGPILHSGITVDQMIANKIGQETAQPSMVLACEQPMTGYHETNYSLAYSSHLSWQSADSPIPNEVYPSLAFDTLFENRGSLRNLSILDRVKDRADSLGRKISSTDKAKLDEYLTSVREVEKRLDAMRKSKEKAEEAGKGAGKPVAMMERPANGLPEDQREHARMMVDIIALAFQTDKTRVATLLLARDLSAMIYPWLNVKEGHHGASHSDLSDSYERISNFHLSQLAYLATKLDAMPEGNGTVLDNSFLMFFSNMWSGTKHDNSKLPIITAGSYGGTVQTGRVLDYYKAGDENRKIASLYLSLMDRTGIKLDRFGDATTRLQNF
ncbi:MAG: DUF1552 domain-containing protein [Acidobacteriia bacterium]|jgi:hypothetical protein|nr:DUF1552 domain-containing protein [Terriglobia bacterium]